MISYLYNRVVAGGWIPPESARSPNDCLGVLLRRSRGNYVTAPDPAHHVLLAAVARLNLAVAVTLRPQMLDGILKSLSPGQTEIRFKDGSQVQIIDSLALAHSASVKKFQYACVCRQERLILVWHDDLQHVVPVATQTEEKLLSLVRLATTRSVGLRFELTHALGLAGWQAALQHPPDAQPRPVHHVVRHVEPQRILHTGSRKGGPGNARWRKHRGAGEGPRL